MATPFPIIEQARIEWREGQPRSILFNDIYFAKEGGLAEKQHVFIEGNDLIQRWQKLDKQSHAQFVIAETGFGSGLNFLLTWLLWKKHAPTHAKLHYYSCEKYPLSKAELARCLMLWPSLFTEAQQLLAQYPELTPGYHLLQWQEIHLTLMLGDATTCYQDLLLCGDAVTERQLRTTYVDAWFLDGFTPAKNPEMWSRKLFNMIALLSKSTTTLATYSAASPVKNELQSVGFITHKKAGYGCKRDMLIATYQSQLPLKLPCHTPWYCDYPKKITSRRVIILGAGLAGCILSDALSCRGWEVTLIDKRSQVAQGASGNRKAILYPTLSAFASPLTHFMLSSYLYALRFYRTILQQEPIGELTGILQIPNRDKAYLNHQHLKAWIQHYPTLGTFLNAEQASLQSGIHIEQQALFLPQAGWIDSPRLCRHLINRDGVKLVLNECVDTIHRENGIWHAGNYQAEHLVIATGYEANTYLQTQSLPLKPIRGQMTSVMSNSKLAGLKIPICGSVHILPIEEDYHDIGTTYHSGSTDSSCYSKDDELNVAHLKQLSKDCRDVQHITGHWAGIRVATPDYLPLVGPVPQVEAFNLTFAGLRYDSKRFIAKAGPYYEGLYMCAGFGSRGLTTVPLSVNWLASLMSQEPSSLPRTMIQSFSPARFLRRKIIRDKL